MWIKTRSNRIKVWSDRIKMRSDRIKMRIKMRSKGDQNAEQGGAKHGERWSKGYVFLFDSELESYLEASSFKYRITEISEKGLY